MDAIGKRKMLKDMMRIRVFEERLYQLVEAGNMNGFLHLYLGEEAVAVGVCSALNKDDYITSTHRGHGHLIAKGVPTRDMMAELYGKANGCNKGKGGSMHICVPAFGIIGSNGIVGGGIPLATGAALTAKYTHSGRISVCFFGDGASNEGSFHESLNMAAIWKLPVIYVCENNMYACNTAFTHASNTSDVADRAKAYNIPSEIVDGCDVEAVYNTLCASVEYVRAGNGPMLIECKTYRWFEHCIGDPDLRPRDEWQRWKERDAIKLYADKLIGKGVIDQSAVDELWNEAKIEITDAIQYGEDGPEPALNSLLEDVYSE
ncbi:MAG: thiamine pyrophosphate-dependent dehydrogenase E1 component subunit alpha [Clostridia bacterium]